ncbi:MAG TPA: family 16 glycosylhydrolase [Thermoplasmata archaeon]|nr:family 16 glycosylhydrolase [Thermoplasmata archaeon]
MLNHPIKNCNLSEWHEYEVKWKEKEAKFYIDDELVCEASKMFHLRISSFTLG